MSSDWKPTHVTRAGVEVMASGIGESQNCKRAIFGVGDGLTSDVLCTSAGFDALFEPIPKPKMVEIPVAKAKEMLATLKRQALTWDDLSDAIAAAEKEAADA